MEIWPQVTCYTGIWPQAHALSLLVSGHLLWYLDKVTTHLLKGPYELFILLQAKTYKARMWVGGEVMTPVEISGMWIPD